MSRHVCAHHALSSRGFALPGDPPQYGRDRSFAVDEMLLDLNLDFQARSLDGEATMRVRRIDPKTRELELDAVAFENVRIIRVGDGGATRPAVFRYDGARLRIDLSDVPDGGVATVRAAWHATPRRGLFFWGPDAKVPARPRQVWTQGQDEDNRHWFPCQDFPGARMRTELTATVPSGFFALSNGKLVSRAKSSDGTRETFHWSLKDPHPSYLVMLAAGELDEAHDEAMGVPVDYYVPKGSGQHIARSFGRTPEMIKLFVEKIGHPFPWEKYAQIVVTEFFFGGMENTTATVLYDRAILDERAAIDVDVDALIAHELAHQWFGDLLTCREWTHAWLNEGFATFFESVWREHHDGRDDYVYGLIQDLDTWVDEDHGRYRRPIVTNRWASPIDLFDRHLYQKAGLALHALRTHLGDDAFWRGIALYVGRHRGSGVETRDLLRAMEDSTGRSLELFFDQWILRPSMPDLELTQSWEDGVLSVGVAQNGGDDALMSFELVVEVVGAGGTVRHSLAVSRGRETFAIPCKTEPDVVVVDPELAVPGALDDRRPTAALVANLERAPSVAARVRAVRALGKRDETPALKALRTALARDAFWGVRAEAARALAELRSGVALDALLAAPDDVDARVRRTVTSSLGAFRGQERAADRLLADITRGDASWLVEAERFRALGRTRDPRAFAVLTDALAGVGPSWGETRRTGIIDGLGALRDVRAIEPLLAHVAYGSFVSTRRAALAGLGRTLEATTDVAVLTRIREVITEQLEDFDPAVKIGALDALTQLRHPSALAAMDRAARIDLDGRVRRRAREADRELRDSLADGAQVPALKEEVDRLRQDARKVADRLAALEARLDAKPDARVEAKKEPGGA